MPAPFVYTIGKKQIIYCRTPPILDNMPKIC